MKEIWTVVHTERESLIQDLETLTKDRWATLSLCQGWDVHDVLAHLIDDAKTTRLGFARRLVAAKFDFDRCNVLGVARERAEDPAHTLARFRTVSARTTSAPAPLATRLVEVCVHGEDIRRPLGMSHTYPIPHLVTALRYQLNTSTKFGGGKERAEGLRLIATDTELSVGDGREVHGTALALLLAVSGRPVARDELTGRGATALVQ